MNVRILHERARHFQATAEGPWFSIKSMLAGSARYRVGKREMTVGHGFALLLNEGTPYTITIDSSSIVESFVVFLSPAWVHSAMRSHLETHERLLDDPFGGGTVAFRFQETLYPLQEDLDQAHRHIRNLHGAASTSHETGEAAAVELITACVRRQLRIADEIDGLNATRAATRHELHRRLQLARDFMLSHLAETVSLNQVTANCCLSPFHLARQFKQLYGEAPMTFLRRARVERAVHLLRTTNKTVLEVCLDVGWESPTSFCTTIKRFTGLSPRGHRKLAN